MAIVNVEIHPEISTYGNPSAKNGEINRFRLRNGNMKKKRNPYLRHRLLLIELSVNGKQAPQLAVGLHVTFKKIRGNFFSRKSRENVPQLLSVRDGLKFSPMQENHGSKFFVILSCPMAQ
jgi:hypothetical protein